MSVKQELILDEEVHEFRSQSETKRPRIVEMISSEEEFSSDTTSEIYSFPCLSTCPSNIYTSSEDEDESINDNTLNTDNDWSDPTGNQPQITPFSGTPGFKLLDEQYMKVEDFYLLLISDDIFQTVVEETNLYAQQVLFQKQSSRLDVWVPTDKSELKRFFGLIIWMGLVKLPEAHLYWSKDPAYVQTFPASIMSRNRFEILLRMLHFANNENSNPVSDWLYKIRMILDKVNENFQKYYDPSEILCIDESVIPFRDASVLNQYSKRESIRLGMKLLKLCTSPGYTYNFQIYCEKKLDGQKATLVNNMVMRLCKNILGKGHILCADNRHTSFDLVKKLIEANTHVIGALRNHRGISKEIATKKLKRREHFAKENRDGITLLKWKDKRDVLLLSTKHSLQTAVVKRKGKECTKPQIIVDYNEGKSYIKMSDQMTPFCSQVTKSIKWYQKVAFELFLNTAVLNAWIIYNSVTRSNTSCLEFRKKLALYLTHCHDENSGNSPSLITGLEKKRHELKKKQGKYTSVRQRCKYCYEQNVKKFGTQLARDSTTKVITYCDDCPNKPHLCLECFNIKHRNIPL